MALVQKIGGLVNSLISDQNAGMDDYNAAMATIRQKIDQNWALPSFDQTPLTPEEFKLLQVYHPEVAAYVQQQQPALIPTNTLNEGTQAQRQALDQLSQLSKTGTDLGMRAQLDEAQMAADQSLRSNRANALAALANRGLGSSGATLSADIIAGNAAAEQQRMASLQAASQAAQRKLQAISGLGSLGSQVANQNQQAQEFNANTINQYNNIITNRRQQYEDYVAQTHNQGNLFNQQNLQNIQNQNVATRNQAQENNRARQDRNETSFTNASNDKLKLLSGLDSQNANTQLQTAQQQSQNNTRTFLTLAGLGAGAALGGWRGALGAAIPAAAGVMASPPPSISTSSPYSLGVDTNMSQPYSNNYFKS